MRKDLISPLHKDCTNVGAKSMEEYNPNQKSTVTEPFAVRRKKQSMNACIASDRSGFLDNLNYLAPGFSYQNYLTALGIDERNSFFPYEYITHLNLKRAYISSRGVF
ncbi:hypothetical protein ElyMa_000412700 [Elysia marginata]|uniref:Uncharacterized protein n=1 Tax=Elysia marginata TaxID=1093978 RepID=A0AAV4FLL3_9GAST|nr:hypothetical protein ElyMa_000412700 [Elysia marginata]